MEGIGNRESLIKEERKKERKEEHRGEGKYKTES